MLLSHNIVPLLIRRILTSHTMKHNVKFAREFFHKYIITTVTLLEAAIRFIIIPKRPENMTKINFSINLFTVVNIVIDAGSILRFPLSVHYFDSRGLCPVPKDEGSHSGYQTATYHV